MTLNMTLNDKISAVKQELKNTSDVSTTVLLDGALRALERAKKFWLIPGMERVAAHQEKDAEEWLRMY